MEKVSVDVIVLTKDNNIQLEQTLASIPRQGLLEVRVLVVDGGSAEALVSPLVQRFDNSNGIKISYVNSAKLGANGIYPSMNLALDLIVSDWFIFMNSGDLFSTCFDFSTLYSFFNDPKISVVFGQARIFSGDRGVRWLVPDAKVKNIGNWLAFFEPNHQAMFCRLSVAHSYSFDVTSPIGADAAWKRQVLQRESYLYLTKPVCDYFLGGISSISSLRLLRIKLREPSRRPLERIMELLKFILYLLGINSPRLQAFKSYLVGFFF